MAAIVSARDCVFARYTDRNIGADQSLWDDLRGFAIIGADQSLWDDLRGFAIPEQISLREMI